MSSLLLRLERQPALMAAAISADEASMTSASSAASLLLRSDLLSDIVSGSAAPLAAASCAAIGSGAGGVTYLPRQGDNQGRNSALSK